jgi:hypothetical protein
MDTHMKHTDFLLIENKAQYTAMIKPLIDIGLIDANEAQSVLSFVRKELKRNDRIVWWLKWYRILKLTEGIQQTQDNPNNPSLIKMQKMLDKATKVPGSTNPRDVRAFNAEFGQSGRTNLSHYISMMGQVPAMDNIVWDASLTPHLLKRELDKKESEWQQAAKQEIDVDQYDDPNYAGRSPWKKVIDYGQQAWVLIDKDYCDLEGKAMGHCGNNQGRSDRDGRILSFRTIINDKRQKPHLTFIISADGKLGEMKGRANEKPAEKYHKVIVDLLLSDMVTRITGGGHDPANNFSVNDLSDEMQETLFSKKPVFASMKYKIKNGIATNDDFDEIREVFSEYNFGNDADFAVDIATNTVTLGSFDDMDDIAKWAGVFDLNQLKYLADTVHEGHIEMYNTPSPDSYEMQTLIDGLDREMTMALFQYVEENMGDPDDYHDDNDNVAEIIIGDDQLDEVYSAFERASADAMEMGAMNEMYEALQSTLKNNGIVYNPSKGSPYYLMLTSLNEALSLYDEIAEDDYIEMDYILEMLKISDADELRNGYDGYDEGAGIERLFEHLYDIDGIEDIYKKIKASTKNESLDRMRTLAGI